MGGDKAPNTLDKVFSRREPESIEASLAGGSLPMVLAWVLRHMLSLALQNMIRKANWTSRGLLTVY